MAGEITDDGAVRAINATTGRISVSPLSTYVALLTAAPEPTDTMEDLAEVAAPGTSGYARQQAVWSAPVGSPPVSGNVDTLIFGPFDDDLDSVTHCGLVTAQVTNAGSVLFVWELENERDAGVGDSIEFGSNSLTIKR
jgi:hypothetical protein